MEFRNKNEYGFFKFVISRIGEHFIKDPVKHCLWMSRFYHRALGSVISSLAYTVFFLFVIQSDSWTLQLDIILLVGFVCLVVIPIWRTIIARRHCI